MGCSMKGEDMRRLKSKNDGLGARYRAAPVVAVTDDVIDVARRLLEKSRTAHENLRSQALLGRSPRQLN